MINVIGLSDDNLYNLIIYCRCDIRLNGTVSKRIMLVVL
jgi:hypothetical protein